MIRNIIFDVGNVLVDFRPKGVLKDLGICEEDAERLLDFTVRQKRWEELDRGVIPEEEVIAQMRENVPEELRYAFDLFFEKGKMDLVRPFAYAEEWLAGLKKRGFGVYILSNYPVSYFELHREKFTFLKHADGEVVSGWVKLLKPDAAIYELLLEKYGLKAEECIFVDDRAENAEGANAVGIHGVQFVSFEGANEAMEALIAEK